MCRDVIQTDQKPSGIFDMEIYKLSKIDEKKILNGNNNMNELDSMFLEALKNIIIN